MLGLLSAKTRLSKRLVSIALSEGYQITSDAIKLLEKTQNPVDTLIKIIHTSSKENKLQKRKVIDSELVSASLEIPKEQQPTAIPQERSEEEIYRRLIDPHYEILFSWPGDYKIDGEINEFMQYFKSKYYKLRRIIEHRRQGYIPIVELAHIQNGSEAFFIGMVMEKKENEKAIILQCDDLSGYTRVIIPKKDEKLMREAEDILPDQVLGFKVRKLDNGSYVASEIHFPEVDSIRRANSNVELKHEVYACLISDVHVGSKKFRRDLFESFLDWLARSRDGVAKRVKYLVINGDFVDGIGVYPRQEKELETADVEEQFREGAKLLAEIPDEVEIILCPGNHEPVRKSLPQPPIGGKYRNILNKARRINFGTNPSTIILHGRRLIVYHGQGLEEVIEYSQNISYSILDKKIDEALVKLMRSRHLAPCYGGNTQVMPLPEDPLVIEETPDLLHTGHTHTATALNYKGVYLINSGTWQDQTDYQKNLGINPTVGTAILVELSKMKISIMHFT